jgi:hypothetical protein
MNLISFIIVCLAIGLILWLINTYTRIPAEIKTVLNVGVAIILVLWLLGAVLGYGPSIVLR